MAEAELTLTGALALQTEVAAAHDGEALTMEFCARQLLESDYGPVFEREYERSRALCGTGYALPPSSYVARLSGDALAAYERGSPHHPTAGDRITNITVAAHAYATRNYGHMALVMAHICKR